MANQLVQARVSNELKLQAEMIFSSMGMTTSDAIRIFLQQSVNSGGLPFQPSVRMPNKETLSAMKEADGRIGKKFSESNDFFKDLDI